MFFVFILALHITTCTEASMQSRYASWYVMPLMLYFFTILKVLNRIDPPACFIIALLFLWITNSTAK